MRKFLSLILCLALSAALAVPAFAASPALTDVPTTHWAYSQINEAVEAGITNGYSDGSFKPGASVTYAHFVAFLARAFYSGEYSDANASPWYQPYWDVLASHKIVEGTQVNAALLQTGSITSKVNTSINRYDMAMMMFNIIEDKGGAMPSGSELNKAQQAIGDYSSIDYFYRECVKTCYALGLLNGQADGTFGGSNYMNRAQGCVVISRLKDYLEDGSTGVTPSVPDDSDENTPSSGATYDTTKYNVPADTNKDGILTEEEVQTAIMSLKDEYPQSSAWGDDKTYYSSGIGWNGEGCAAYAFMVSDSAFGALPKRVVTSVDNLRVGDILHSSKINHWSVITDIDGEYIHYTSGNNGGKVSWIQSTSIDEEKQIYSEGYLTYYTRYPA